MKNASKIEVGIRQPVYVRGETKNPGEVVRFESREEIEYLGNLPPGDYTYHAAYADKGSKEPFAVSTSDGSRWTTIVGQDALETARAFHEEVTGNAADDTPPADPEPEDPQDPVDPEPQDPEPEDPADPEPEDESPQDGNPL